MWDKKFPAQPQHRQFTGREDPFHLFQCTVGVKYSTLFNTPNLKHDSTLAQVLASLDHVTPLSTFICRKDSSFDILLWFDVHDGATLKKMGKHLIYNNYTN